MRRRNARLVASAERYYRAMYRGGAESWNLRDTHMVETLEQLLEAGGPDAKAVVWAHNSHIGDARRTEMGTLREELNPRPARARAHRELRADRLRHARRHGRGGAHDWGDDVRIMDVRPSLDDSVERACHEASEATGAARFLLDLREQTAGRPARALAARAARTATGAFHRRRLPSRYRTGQPLRRRGARRAVRRLGVHGPRPRR